MSMHSPLSMPPNLFGRLAVAERKLKRDGLTICLQSDGSGRVIDFNDVYVFVFDTSRQLNEWLKKPQIFEYNDFGEPIAPEKVA